VTDDIEARVAAKVAELGRKLTAQELIEIINEEPDEPEELTYEED
jgi:hypothetical protein